jgi:FkbM family methyltransferase
MVLLKKTKKNGRKISLATHVMILASLGLIVLILITRTGETFTDVDPPNTNSLINVDNLNLEHFLKRTSGKGWQMWDKKEPIMTEWTQYKECRWTTFKATNGKTAKICTHYGDAVSRAVINRGRWADCDILTHQFTGTHPNKKARVFMDVGANIGACTLQMLFTTDAPIFAFEPEPMNLFCLTNTIMRLEERYRERFILFPFALGDTERDSVINSQIGDFGNSVIGEVVKDRAKEKFRHPVPIHIEPLDSIVTADDEIIALIKLHAVCILEPHHFLLKLSLTHLRFSFFCIHSKDKNV